MSFVLVNPLYNKRQFNIPYCEIIIQVTEWEFLNNHSTQLRFQTCFVLNRIDMTSDRYKFPFFVRSLLQLIIVSIFNARVPAQLMCMTSAIFNPTKHEQTKTRTLNGLVCQCKHNTTRWWYGLLANTHTHTEPTSAFAQLPAVSVRRAWWTHLQRVAFSMFVTFLTLFCCFGLPEEQTYARFLDLKAL